MKKLFAILLAVALVFTLVACGGGAKEKFKVDVFFYTFNDTYLTTVRNTLTKLLDAKADTVNYTLNDCETDQAKETAKVENAITQGTNLLIVNIVTTGSEEAAQNICDLAKKADVPIIFFNREVSDNVVKSYEKCCFVGTDPDEAGYMQGQMMYDFFSKDENLKKYDVNGDGQLTYIMLRGELGNAEAFGRTLYSVKKANELFGKTVLVPSKANQTDSTQPDDGVSPFYLYANWSTATASDLMRTALTSFKLDNGDIELIIANNDDAALGAIEAMNESGYNTGDAAKYIPTFGVDYTTVASEAIKAGKMTGSVLQDGIGMADCLVALMTNVINGEALFANTSSYNVDEGVNKIRIPYAIMTE